MSNLTESWTPHITPSPSRETSGAGGMTTGHLRQTGFLLVAGVFLIYASVLRPVLISPDERSMLAVSLRLLDGDLSVPADMGSVGPDGRVYSNWYPLASVIAMPAVALGRSAAVAAGLPPIYVAAPFAALTTVAVTAIGSLMVWLLALRLGGSPSLALQSGVIYAFGTVLLFYGRSFFADPLLATLVTGGLWSALGTGRRASRGTMACTALAVLAKPTGIVLGGAIAAWHVTQRQWQRAGAALSGALIGLAIYGVYNWLRFGDAATFGQRWGGFTLCCVPEAVTGLLVSPGRGLLLYSPISALALWALLRAWRTPPAQLVIAVVAGFVAVHAVWGDWLGGWSWGSRLLVPMLGALCASIVLAPPRLGRLVPVLGLAGCILNAPTLVWSFHQLAGESAVNGTSERDRVWAPGTSQLVQAWPSAVASVQRARQVDARTVIAAAGTNDSGADSAEVYKVVPVWWWLTPAVGVPLWISASLAFALMLSGAGLLWRAWRICSARVAIR